MKSAFQTIYGTRPEWIASAPGRVNLIGDHTDYNEGFALPMAIDRHTTIAAAPNQSDSIVLRSTAIDEAVRINLSEPIVAEARGQWANYSKGVIAGFLKAGHVLGGFNALIDSNVPIGGGLSSSAALEVATATLLEAVAGVSLDPTEKARLCQTAEHEFAGMPCGIMDQLISALGRKDAFLLIDCRSLETTLVPQVDPAVGLLVFDTRIKHQHARGEYALRRCECMRAAQSLGVGSLREATREQLQSSSDVDPILIRRARHNVTENERTVKAAECLVKRRWHELGTLMYQSHESLRDDFEISCPEVDAVVEIAQEIGVEGGVYGCRMTGGGFGGCAVAWIRKAPQTEIIDKMAAAYRASTGIDPTVFVTTPADGARLVEIDATTDGAWV